MSEPLFYISITISVVDLLVAIVFYCRLLAPFLPRMPTNVANQIAFFAGSHVMDDVQNAVAISESLIAKGLGMATDGTWEKMGRCIWALSVSHMSCV